MSRRLGGRIWSRPPLDCEIADTSVVINIPTPNLFRSLLFYRAPHMNGTQGGLSDRVLRVPVAMDTIAARPKTAMLRLMDLKTETLERASYVATIAAAIVAVIALGLGYFQFESTERAERETLRLQREAVQDEREVKAIELTMKFNELEAERSGKSGRAWSQDNEAITLAESIFDLVGEDPGWKATVKWMVEDESKYAKDTRLDCDTYEPKFVAFVKTILGPKACE